MVEIICKQCDRIFLDYPCRKDDRVTCSKVCAIKLTHTGRKNSKEIRKKMRNSPAWKLQESVVRDYKDGATVISLAKRYGCDKRTLRSILKENKIELRGRKGITAWNKNVPNPDFHGEKNPNWKGGITPLVQKVRSCDKYLRWRDSVYKRDSYTCQICSKRSGDINADHYPKLFSAIFQENKVQTYQEAMKCKDFWDINNGRTLCVPCHKKVTFNY